MTVLLVKSPVYKGEFYANHIYQVKTGEFNAKGRPKHTNRYRPKEEWIKVDVPPIVTPTEWELAQEVMARNKKRASRNGEKRGWLLQGIIKCGICRDYAFVAIKGNTKNNPRRYYGCSSRNSEKARMLDTQCRTPYIYADELERRVWEEIEAIIYDPEVIISRLDERINEEFAAGYQAQIEYIDKKLDDLKIDRTKFEAAYQRDIYTSDEFEVKMKDLKEKAHALEKSKAKVMAQLIESHSIEEKKQVVLTALEKIRLQVDQAKAEKKQPSEIPMELKRRIITTLVEVIWVNSKDKTFTIEGEITGVFAFGEDGGVDYRFPDLIPDNADIDFTSSRK